MRKPVCLVHVVHFTPSAEILLHMCFKKNENPTLFGNDTIWELAKCIGVFFLQSHIRFLSKERSLFAGKCFKEEKQDPTSLEQRETWLRPANMKLFQITRLPPGSFSAYGAWYNIHHGGQQHSILKCKDSGKPWDKGWTRWSPDVQPRNCMYPDCFCLGSMEVLNERLGLKYRHCEKENVEATGWLVGSKNYMK